MKVKVIGCSGNLYWYRDKIGQIFNVEPYNPYNVPEFRCKLIGESKYLDLQDIELVKEEEKVTQLKTGWSIACHNEDTFNAIISLCKALGYPIWGGTKFDSHWRAVGPGCVTGNVCMMPNANNHFECMADFLVWHFKPEEPELTEEQKEILEIEKIIQSCKDQIEEASMRVKKLKEMKK